ncbi:recombination directionality factor [Flexivirga sp.]|uniref:recombination directionality factor n=1 Tax=Flexivirga sp. TaxID=1962927 RepID=UPI003F80C573
MRFANDVVGRFRSGHQISGKPISLSEWRVTTGDPEVADKVQSLMGGDEPQEWETKGDDNVEVFTTSGSVDIILDDPEKALDAHFYIWPRGHGEALPFDPREFTSGAEHDGAREMLPLMRLWFRLANDPTLGAFEFRTAAWSFATQVSSLREELQQYDGPVAASLTLEPVDFESGGKTIRFTKPVVKIKRGV